MGIHKHDILFSYEAGHVLCFKILHTGLLIGWLGISYL